MLDQPWFWIFNLVITLLLLLDLFVFHRKAHVIHVKEAIWLSAFWIAVALAFNVYVYYLRGTEDALKFLTGYLVEKSLSVDNLFVFVLIFSYCHIPPHLLHTVLFWGVLGAIVMRAIFILCGIALINMFHWIIYLFGIFLIYTGIKLALEKDKKIEPENNPLIKLFQKFVPVTHEFHGDHFFIKQAGRYVATPLFIALLAVEITDVIFAVDSIPAIIGITNDPFIVYTSNILAILGLRSLYFALAHIITRFHYLNYGLAAILIFIGVKMLLAGYFHIPIGISLGVIAAILAISVIASLLDPKEETKVH